MLIKYEQIFIRYCYDVASWHRTSSDYKKIILVGLVLTANVSQWVC